MGSDVAKQYLDWCWDSGHPSEHYWNVLNYNQHLNAPGSYIGQCVQLGTLFLTLKKKLLILQKVWIIL